MPRGTVTQVRTFNYGTPPGLNLLSATNPENGTVTYTYNADGTVKTRVDAMNHKTEYSYDWYRRLTQIRYDNSSCAAVEIGYDSNAVDATYSQYTLGRMATRTYPGAGCDATVYKHIEMYSYSRDGQVTKKRFRMTRSVAVDTPSWHMVTISADLDSTYGYDGEGRLTSMTYPTVSANWLLPTWDYTGGGTVTYGYDAMGRLSSMGSGGNTTASATYGAGGELRTLTNWGRTETRTYNSRMQLTSISVPGEAAHTYTYSGTENNGRIASETDGITGEQVVYQYDELNRLISAVTADNPSVTQWGQQFSYDGYGNLTDKDVIKGSAPVLHQLVDPATNQMPYGYDANGNWHQNGSGLYDAENRLTMTYPNNQSFGATYYGYDPDNHRIIKKVANGEGAGDTEITFWSPMGQALGTYKLAEDTSTPSVVFVYKREYWYFGSRLLAIGTDRVGSIGKYYPYGEQRGTATADEAYKFATYFRDGDSGLDYAVNRYYDSGTGRFLSADPYMSNEAVADPMLWNRYAYVGGDPANYTDPHGLDRCTPGTEATCVEVTAPAPDSVSVYPYPLDPFSTGDVLGPWRPIRANNDRLRTTADGSSRDRLGNWEARQDCYKQVDGASKSVHAALDEFWKSFWSMESGVEVAASKGTVFGALEGALSREIFGVVLSRTTAAVLGGVVGFTVSVGSTTLLGPVIYPRLYSLSMSLGDFFIGSLRTIYLNDCDRKFPVQR